MELTAVTAVTAIFSLRKPCETFWDSNTARKSFEIHRNRKSRPTDKNDDSSNSQKDKSASRQCPGAIAVPNDLELAYGRCAGRRKQTKPRPIALWWDKSIKLYTGMVFHMFQSQKRCWISIPNAFPVFELKSYQIDQFRLSSERQCLAANRDAWQDRIGFELWNLGRPCCWVIFSSIRHCSG